MPVHSLRRREGKSDVSPSGFCAFLCICATRVFLGGKSRKEWSGQRHRVQKLVYIRNLFSSILSRRICDRSAQFLVNCFKKIVTAINSSGFYSTFLLVSEGRRERERRERHRARINRRASEEDSSAKFMQHLRLVY